MSKLVSFAGFECRVVKMKYGRTDETALVLQDAQDGSPVATATIRIPENEGMGEVLVAAGVIELTGRTVRTGYVIVPVARVLI